MTSTELVRSISKAVTDPDPESKVWDLISSLSSLQTIDNAASEEIQSKRTDEDEDENPKLRPAACRTERLISNFERAAFLRISVELSIFHLSRWTSYHYVNDFVTCCSFRRVGQHCPILPIRGGYLIVESKSLFVMAVERKTRNSNF